MCLSSFSMKSSCRNENLMFGRKSDMEFCETKNFNSILFGRLTFVVFIYSMIKFAYRNYGDNRWHLRLAMLCKRTEATTTTKKQHWKLPRSISSCNSSIELRWRLIVDVCNLRRFYNVAQEQQSYDAIAKTSETVNSRVCLFRMPPFFLSSSFSRRWGILHFFFARFEIIFPVPFGMLGYAEPF